MDDEFQYRTFCWYFTECYPARDVFSLKGKNFLGDCHSNCSSWRSVRIFAAVRNTNGSCQIQTTFLFETKQKKKKRRLDPWHCLIQRWRTSWLSTVIPRCAWAGRAASTAMVAAMRKVLKIDSILYMFCLQWRYPSYFNPSFIYTMYPSDMIDSEA